MSETIFVTGAAGFIGFHISRYLINNGFTVFGFDNINDYYDIRLKEDRLKILYEEGTKKNNWFFKKGDLLERALLEEIFNKYNPSIVINLAAQAGVRYSIENPQEYINSNILGFLNILECCKSRNVKNFLYASSSSVYGGNKKLPFSENDPVNHPKNIYAATKKSNELMAHSYSHLYNIPATGLRFFTVYGPWGRPDMAPMIFAKSILEGSPIEVFNHGDMQRDFTFIDDVVAGIFKCCFKPASFCNEFNLQKPLAAKSFAPHRIFNIGNGNPCKLLFFIETLEKALGKKAHKIMKDMHKADVQETFADTKLIEEWIGFNANTSIEKGIQEFADWYMKYYS